jgi:hypothetical protein
MTLAERSERLAILKDRFQTHQGLEEADLREVFELAQQGLAVEREFAEQQKHSELVQTNVSMLRSTGDTLSESNRYLERLVKSEEIWAGGLERLTSGKGLAVAGLIVLVFIGVIGGGFTWVSAQIPGGFEITMGDVPAQEAPDGAEDPSAE